MIIKNRCFHFSSLAPYYSDIVGISPVERTWIDNMFRGFDQKPDVPEISKFFREENMEMSTWISSNQLQQMIRETDLSLSDKYRAIEVIIEKKKNIMWSYGKTITRYAMLKDTDIDRNSTE
jgi:hypothetical protein